MDHTIDMPFYEYQSMQNSGCTHCKDGFDALQKISDPPVEVCPKCGSAVRRVISAPNLAKSSPSLDPKNIEKHGFTQYKKSGKGTYEKTAGSGPRTISKDQL